MIKPNLRLGINEDARRRRYAINMEQIIGDEVKRLSNKFGKEIS